MLRKINIKKSNNPKRHRAPWLVRWREPGGKCCQRAFPTNAMAKQFAQKQFVEINAAEFETITSKSWTELTEQFVAAKKSAQVALGTLAEYDGAFKSFEAANGTVKSDHITKAHIDRFKHHQTTEHAVAAITINKKLTCLSTLFTWATERAYMKKNPIDKSDRLRVTRKIKTVWTPEQFQQLLAVVDNEQWLCLILLAVNGVGRKQSLAELEREQVDLEGGTVKVFESKTKTERITPLHSRTLEALTAYMGKIPPTRKRVFDAGFHRLVWQRYITAAKLPAITFHDLRTCTSTWLKTAGIQSEIVSSVFGHSSIELTAKHYTSLDSLDNKKVAIDKLPI